jgi:hypothetical protein
MLVLGTLGIGACDLVPGGIPGASCDQLKTGDFSSLQVSGGADVKGKVVAFLEGTFELDKLVVDMEGDLIASCAKLGAALGVPEAELKAEPGGGDGAKAVCSKAQAKIEGILKANASAKLSISVTPPRCYADITAMTTCLEGCGAVIEPGELKASCKDGKLAGSCNAECSGTCSAEGNVKCTGKCDGTCNGKCEGKDSSGKCDGKCEGECSGGCELAASAKCDGTCTGECSAEFEAPKCTGEFKPPKVDPSCHAKCSAKAAASATCEPPGVDIKLEGEANADIEKLIAALKADLPGILKIQLGSAERIGIAAKSVVSAGAELPSIAADAGLSALGCIGSAVDMAGSASASVSVNVEVSASVSGSAGAGS